MLLICFEQEGPEMPLDELAARRGFGTLPLSYIREVIKHKGYDGGQTSALVASPFRLCDQPVL